MNETDFVGALHQSQKAIRALDGFIRRETFKAEDGQWVDVVHWHSMDDAHNALEIFANNPDVQPLASMIDESSINMMHFELVTDFA